MSERVASKPNPENAPDTPPRKARRKSESMAGLAAPGSVAGNPCVVKKTSRASALPHHAEALS